MSWLVAVFTYVYWLLFFSLFSFHLLCLLLSEWLCVCVPYLDRRHVVLVLTLSVP